MMTLLDAMADRNLFASWFRSPATWAAWRTFICALFGLPLHDEEALAIFRQCTGREHAPSTQAREAWLIVGRRGGKSFMMAVSAVYLACFREYRQYLAPGEKATILLIAADRKQARVLMRYIKAFLTNIPLLSPLVERETAESIYLTNDVVIEVATASYRSVRGVTLAAAILDEIAFWRDETSANPDTEVLNALRPAMLTIPDALLMAASSPYARRGVLYEQYQRHWGRDGPILVWRASTLTMNPAASKELIDKAFDEDPAAASAEYGGQFRSDLQAYVDREAVAACVDVGIRERPYERKWRYHAFADPSGGSADSFTLAVAHREGQTAVLDVVREIRPPFSPEAVVEEYAALLKGYKITQLIGDRYAGEWVREPFRARGTTYTPSEKVRSDIYIDFLPLVNSGLVGLLDDHKLIAQLCSLERRTAARGKDVIDHPPGGHDDLVNSAAGALELAFRTGSGVEQGSWQPRPAPRPPVDPLEMWR